MHYSNHTTTLLHIQHSPTPLASGTYSTVMEQHSFCIVNMKDSNTHLYILMLKSFDPVPLKWDPVQLLHGHVVLYQGASDGGNAYLIYIVEFLPICKYLLP